MANSHWAAYARLQSMLSSTTDAYKSAGIEAAMTDLLEKFAQGKFLTPQQLQNLVVNRTGRERRRSVILRSRQHCLTSEPTSESSAESRLTLGKCAEICGDRDFALLLGCAMGHSYRELAEATGTKPNALKIRAHRARQKITHLAA